MKLKKFWGRRERPPLDPPLCRVPYRWKRGCFMTILGILPCEMKNITSMWRGACAMRLKQILKWTWGKGGRWEQGPDGGERWGQMGAGARREAGSGDRSRIQIGAGGSLSKWFMTVIIAAEQFNDFDTIVSSEISLEMESLKMCKESLISMDHGDWYIWQD